MADEKYGSIGSNQKQNHVDHKMCGLTLPRNIPRGFIFSQPDKLRVSQVTIRLHSVNSTCATNSVLGQNEDDDNRRLDLIEVTVKNHNQCWLERRVRPPFHFKTRTISAKRRSRSARKSTCWKLGSTSLLRICTCRKESATLRSELSRCCMADLKDFEPA
jgi:hypothetical protein